MTQASYQPKARPSPWWYALVALLWIASAAVFSIVAIKPIIAVVTTDLTQFGNGDPVSIGSDGLSVYAEDTDALGGCTLTADGGSPIRMDLVNSVGSEFEVNTTGPTMHAYASTPDSLNAGTYAISCEGGQATILATGERIDEDALQTSLGLGFIASLILGVLGLALLITLLVKRHNSKNRIRAEQSAAYYGAWAQQGYGAPEGTYPPQTYDPYAQQQQQGYGSPQGYTPPPQQDVYGQPPQPPADPYGQPPQPPQPSYEPQQSPAPEPYGQPTSPPEQPTDGSLPPPDPYGQQLSTPEPAAPPESAPEPAAPSDSGDSGQSTDTGGSSPDSGSSDSGSSDSNNN